MARNPSPPSDGSEVINFEDAKRALENAEEISLDDVCSSKDEKTLKQMNEKHAFINSIGGKPMISYYIYNEAFNKELLEFITPDSFRTIYSNQSIAVDKRPIELGVWWLKNSRRREYQTIIFDPSAPKENKGCLNLWEGFATEPKQKNNGWKCTLRHIYKILCNSDPIKFNYVIKWFAWCIQNPGQRAEVSIIFKGKEGAGKGFIFTQFVHLFGQHGMSIANRELLTGKHNGHFAKIVFLFADEAYYPGDKEVEGVIKQLITEPKIPYRAMYKDAVMGANRLHIGMSTNAKWVIPAGEDTRRYFINEVNNQYAKGQCSNLERDLYFSRLWLEMKHNGREAMLYDLLNMPLAGWHPRNDIPDTAELHEQKRLSLSRLHQSIFTFIDDGMLPGEFDIYHRYVVSAQQLYMYLETIDHANRTQSQNKKSEIIKELGAKREKRVTGVHWIFPPLSEVRQAWNDKFVQHSWDDKEQWQIIKTAY